MMRGEERRGERIKAHEMGSKERGGAHAEEKEKPKWGWGLLITHLLDYYIPIVPTYVLYYKMDGEKERNCVCVCVCPFRFRKRNCVCVCVCVDC